MIKDATTLFCVTQVSFHRIKNDAVWYIEVNKTFIEVDFFSSSVCFWAYVLKWNVSKILFDTCQKWNIKGEKLKQIENNIFNTQYFEKIQPSIPSWMHFYTIKIKFDQNYNYYVSQFPLK